MLARASNLSAKLSGLGTFVHANDPHVIAFVYDAAIRALGGDRLMFGSNFPIEKLWTGHAALVVAHRAAAARYPVEDPVNIFRDTALRVYRPA
jgi:predicted TIM-barrel fold metal-dependent hydrolase